MPAALISETIAPCPICRSDMVLAAITPHPLSSQLARHTYLCADCNQTKTYVLPIELSEDDADTPRHPDNAARSPQADADASDRRVDPRKKLDAPATIYDKDGNFLLPCSLRDLSKSGCRLELFKEGALPQYFMLSLLPDGGGRRLCSRVWQLAQIVGVRFVDRDAM
jgi:hypothetical protein